MRIAYSILRKFLKGLEISPEELARLLIEQGLVVEKIWSMEEIFAFPLFAGTLEEIREDFPYSECLVRCGNRIFSVGVENWGVPQEGARVLLSLKDGVPSFLPVVGEGKNVLAFLVVLPDHFPENEEISYHLLGQDVVMDLEVTTNRGDCLSIMGIVRELAAKLDLDWEKPEISYHDVDVPTVFTVRDEEPALCPYYTGKFVENVVVKPSPWEVVRDLYLLGLRPINNVVDITNLVMMETGQPLHAFDASCIREKVVVIRRARAGEKILAIDGVERALLEDMLVIADSFSPIAIAGVMGGKYTEVSPTTREIFLESALFNRVSVRRTAKALGLRTEASARFERGVDPQGVKYASERVLSLLSCQGDIRIARDWAVAGEPPCREEIIRVYPEKINEVLSMQVETKEMTRILKKLGFTILSSEDEEELRVKIPSFRSDVSTLIDVAEEIGRIHGYDRIALRFPSFPFDPGNVEKGYLLERRLRNLLVNRGLREVVTLSFVDPKTVQSLGIKTDSLIAIHNPLSQDQSFLRSQLLLSFLGVLRLNLNRGRYNFGLFEIGKIFYPSGEKESPWKEELRLGVALCGSLLPSLWEKDARVDFFTLKGFAEEILGVLGLGAETAIFFPWSGDLPGFDPGVAFVIRSSTQDLLGWGGKLSEQDLWKLDIRGEIYYLELRLEAMFELAEESVRVVRGATLFPAIVRDISVVLDRDVLWGTIEERVRRIIAQESMAVEKVEVFDVFEGSPLPQDKKGLSFRCVFRSIERTLNDEEVEDWIRKIKEGLKVSGGIYLREEFITA